MSNKKWDIRSFFAYTAFIVSLFILVGLTFIYNQKFKAWSRYNAAIEHTQTVLSNLDNLLSYLKDTETSGRGFLLSKDSSFLQPFFSAHDSLTIISERIHYLLRNNVVQQKRMVQLDTLIQRRLHVLQNTNFMFLNKDPKFNESLWRGKAIMDSCRSLLQQIKLEELALLNESRSQKNSYELATPNSFVVIFGFTIGAFLISFMVIMTEFRSRIKYQQKLETTILELDQFNQELNQITHISSHHLQEPLRKLSLFSDQLLLRHSSQLSIEARSIIDRIIAASARIRELIEDLSNYTRLITHDSPKVIIDIGSLTDGIRQHRFAQRLKKENLAVDSSLVIVGQLDQIELLFECLIQNSIKFAKPGTDPVVAISSADLTKDEVILLEKKTGTTSFTKIVVTDNGIGFDEALSDKMFEIFQKLHPDFEGKGIGLAIVKRVMNNHKGLVIARGLINDGAEFRLYFPKG